MLFDQITQECAKRLTLFVFVLDPGGHASIILLVNDSAARGLGCGLFLCDGPGQCEQDIVQLFRGVRPHHDRRGGFGRVCSILRGHRKRRGGS